MSVKIIIHPGMVQLTDNMSVVEVDGTTVGECLNNLVTRFPAIKSSLMDDNGKILDYVDIFVNGKSSFPEELAMTVNDGDELETLRIIGGG